MQVRVEVETCENLRTLNPSGHPHKQLGSGGSYGFVEKVVDGITVTVNSVLVILHSHVFTASFQVGRLLPSRAECTGRPVIPVTLRLRCFA